MRIKVHFTILTSIATLAISHADPESYPKPSPQPEQKAFEKAVSSEWKQVFSDDCTGDWKTNWFLDGKVGTVTTGKEGMTLTGGPEFKNDAHHMVLWTKHSFKGNIRIDYDYTRLDQENRCVNILYIQASGSGKAPYSKDISKWTHLREVPAMKTYFDKMNSYHISYAAYGNHGKDETSYIRGRRYVPHQKGIKGTELKPDYRVKNFFKTGVKHHITVIKQERSLFMRVSNDEHVEYYHMKNPKLPVITVGRVGLRHMYTRSASYEKIRISVAPTPINEHQQ